MDKLFLKNARGKMIIIVLIILAGFLIRGRLDGLYERQQTREGEGEVNVYSEGDRVGFVTGGSQIVGYE